MTVIITKTNGIASLGPYTGPFEAQLVAAGYAQYDNKGVSYDAEVSPIFRNRNLLDRINRNAAKARANNPRLGVLATGVTVTDNVGTLPAAVAASTLAAFNLGATGIWRYNGGTPTNVGGIIRFKSAKIGTAQGSIGLGDGTQASSWRATVMATSRYVCFRLTPTTSAYRFIVDGKYVDLTGTVLTTTTGNAVQYVLLDFATRATREVSVEGQGTCGFNGGYCEATGRLFPVDTADEVRMAYLGNSYIDGVGPTNKGDGIAFVMADWLGCRVLGSGAPGTGWVNNAGTSPVGFLFGERIANGDLGLDQAPPELICLEATLNDRLLDVPTITANAATGIRAVMAQYPSAAILVFGALPAQYGNAVLNAENAVKAAVDQIIAAATQPTLLAFVPIQSDPSGAWITGNGNTGSPNGSGNGDWATTNDGVHPSTEGAAYIGRREAQAGLLALNSMLK